MKMLRLAFVTTFTVSVLAVGFGSPSFVRAEKELTADEIITRMDRNQVFDSRRADIVMRIHKRGTTRTKKMTTFSKGARTSFSKFTYPARDKGVKYLRIEDNLWMYLPSAEKVMKISGHMLRQSMMGSDFSYEDMLDNGALKDRYNTTLLRSEKINGHDCYVLEMKQKKPGETYPTRRIWVDKKLFTPRKSELYALSGRILKSMVLSKITKYEDRYYPLKMRMENKLRRGTWTEVELLDVKFKVPILKDIFAVKNLRREG